MLYWALVVVFALVTALLGFGGLAVTSAGIATILFLALLVLFLGITGHRLGQSPVGVVVDPRSRLAPGRAKAGVARHGIRRSRGHLSTYGRTIRQSQDVRSTRPA